MTKKEQIEEMTKERNEIKDIIKLLDKCVSLNPMYKSEVASVLYGNNYRKLPEDSVVLSREELSKALTDNFNMGKKEAQSEIKQERPNNTTSQSEKIVYGSLITSTKCYNCIHFPLCFAQKGGANLELASENDCCYYQSKLPEDSVVLSREEYETLKSLYDTQKGAIMTSSVGDLPLTVEGLRKAVDEITRLNRVETELQELNAKYYNEAKDLRRELKQTRKETAEKIISAMKTMIINRRADERSGLNSIYTTYSPERLFDDILDYVRIAMGVEVEQ